MNKYIVVPYVMDYAESKRLGVAVLAEGTRKEVEGTSSVDVAIKHRPAGTQLWHIRKA